MKKLFAVIMAAVALSVSVFMLTSCLNEDAGSDGPEGSGGGGGEGNGDVWDGVKYNFDLEFKVPDSDKVYKTRGRREERTVTVELTEFTIQYNGDYKELRKDSAFVRYGVYLGLFNAPEGGVKCYDTEGNNLGYFSDNGMYYAQFERVFSVGFQGITDELTYATYNLPKTVEYGQELGIASLPIPEDNGKEFIGWYCDQLQAYVTDKDGTFLSGYALVDGKYYLAEKKLSFRPRFKEYNHTVTFDYNDGTYRMASHQYPTGTEWDDMYVPNPAGELREVVGWSLDPYEMIPFEGELTEDVRLYAHWRSYRFIVLVTEPGAETVVRITEGETYSIPAPAKDGYTFKGWYSNELRTGAPVSTSVTYGSPYEFYYAGWEEN